MNKFSVTREILSNTPEGIKTAEVEGKGTGVIASKVFRKHEFVCEYKGQLISKHEAEEREKTYDENTCYLYYFNFKSKSLW